MVRRDLPVHLDELFMLAILLLFLIINYNMPLSQIYQSMVYLTIFMYLVPVTFNLFKWIPFSDKDKRLTEIIVGVGAGIGFIYFYKTFIGSISQMAAVFATTAFGESESLGIFMFGALIPIIESIFFFVILPTWALWKIGKTLVNGSTFSGARIFIIGLLSSVFTIFHATARGIDNNIDLIATFIFAVISLIMVMRFGTVLPAVLMHITVNGYSVGLFDFILGGAILSSPYIIGAIMIGLYWLYKKDKIPFLT